MTKLTLFDRAIAAHGRWKYRLFQATSTGKSQWTEAEVRADDGCDFGVWLKQLPISRRLSQRCARIRALHIEFHEIAADVLVLALAGRKDEAKAMMALGSRFSEVSAALTMALSEWAEAEPEDG